MTFGELQQEVFRNVIDLPTAVQQGVPAFINRAAKRVQKRHNFDNFMKAEAPYVTTASTRILGPLPSRFKEFRERPYWIEDLGRARPMEVTKSAGQAAIAFGTAPDLDFGFPKVIRPTEDGADLEVYPFPDGLSLEPDGEYRVFVPYWRYLPTLEEDEDENWLTLNGSEYLINEATAMAFLVNWDEQRAGVWAGRARQEQAELIRVDKNNAAAYTDTLVPHMGAYNPRIAR